MKKTYLFYDLETTGLSKPFDQILQFAAIRTDLELNEIERYDLTVRLNADICPAPEAILTHEIGIKTMQQGIGEYDAVCQIHALINLPGTISLGYNTLGFDDEFLRFSFYRHLLKPYTHQYADGCGRMDIYPLTIMFYLFKPEILTWPKIDGKNSFKLEYLNQANKLADGKAHHAMTDVEVTLALARKLRQEKVMWDYLLGYFVKETDLARSQALQTKPALLINGRLGAQNNFQCPILFLGQHRHYKNQTVWLRLDSEILSATTPETIAENTWTLNKKPAEPNFILPMEERFLTHLTPERRLLLNSNIAWLQANPAIFQAIKDWHLDFKYPVFPNTDSNARLYLDGFLSREDELFCQKFHQAAPEFKTKLAEQAANQTLKILAARIIARNFPDVLSDSLNKIKFDAATQIDHQGKPRLSAKLALENIQQLRIDKNLSADGLKLLAEYEAYLHKQYITDNLPI